MTSTKNERAVPGSTGSDCMVRKDGKRVVVKWLCGADASFTPADLRDCIKHLESLVAFSDVWLALKDSDGLRFAVRVQDGQMYADGAPTGDAHSVPWDEMRKALMAMLRKAPATK